MQFVPINLCQKFNYLTSLSLLVYCCLCADVDVKELEELRSKKNKLEEEVTVLDSSLKVLQSEQRRFEDEAAQLHRQRVSQLT